MPTNILRDRPKLRNAVAPSGAPGRQVLIKAGRVSVRAELLDTATAVRIWTALPLFSTAETWGTGAIHFETPVESGRERGARLIASLGDICYASEDDRVYIAFARTPISQKGELRLPRPANVWARSVDDVRVFASVQPGQKVSVTVVEA